MHASILFLVVFQSSELLKLHSRQFIHPSPFYPLPTSLFFSLFTSVYLYLYFCLSTFSWYISPPPPPPPPTFMHTHFLLSLCRRHLQRWLLWCEHSKGFSISSFLFARLKFSPKGAVTIAGFSELSEAEPDDIEPWLPRFPSKCDPLTFPLLPGGGCCLDTAACSQDWDPPDQGGRSRSTATTLSLEPSSHPIPTFPADLLVGALMQSDQEEDAISIMFPHRSGHIFPFLIGSALEPAVDLRKRCVCVPRWMLTTFKRIGK